MGLHDRNRRDREFISRPQKINSLDTKQEKTLCKKGYINRKNKKDKKTRLFRTSLTYINENKIE